MATTRTSGASIYALLQVHPAAPLELITAVYWRLVGRAGVSSRGEGAAGSRVRQLERAYQVVSDPEKRAAYDSAMNIPANAPLPSLGGDVSSRSAEAEQPARVDRDSLLFNVSMVASALSVLCLVLGMATSSLDLTDYGIARSFPISFYVGLVLLPLASSCLWFTNRKVDAIVLGQLLWLMIAIWRSPYLLEGTARFRPSYKNVSAVDSLADGGGFAPDRVGYHHWPGLRVVVTGE